MTGSSARQLRRFLGRTERIPVPQCACVWHQAPDAAFRSGRHRVAAWRFSRWVLVCSRRLLSSSFNHSVICSMKTNIRSIWRVAFVEPLCHYEYSCSMKHEFEKEGDMMEQMIEAAGLQCASSRHDAMRDVAFDVRNSDVPTFSRNMDSSDAQRRDSRVIIGVCDEHGVRMAKKGHSTMCLTLRGKIVFSMMGACCACA